MSNHQDDLELLLSLQDRVLETPPGSPSTSPPHSPGYLSDEGSPRQRGQADMSVFRDAVLDCLDYEPNPVEKIAKLTKASSESEIERFSGLRIRNQLVSPQELSDRFSDIRFVRLSAIKNLLVGDTLSGCWATVGVLTENGSPKTSSTGKSYCIWKIACLDETTISLFLFGDAYKKYCKEKAGTVFALFNCSVRKDGMGPGFSLSLFSPNQMLKMGSSIDYGVCKGKRKDGLACTSVINRRRGIYCKYHKSKESQKYTTMRTELKGGNISRTAFMGPRKSEGIYMVDPLANKTNVKKPNQPVKLLSVEGLKKALSNAGKVTTNTHSQGIRFLAEITGKTAVKNMNKESTKKNQQSTNLEKRKSTLNTDTSELIRNQQIHTKRNKTEKEQTTADINKQGTGKMIELDYVSSDEDI
ncbi:hypothetical protein UlMin_030944 [Ulmus minor]